MEITLNDVNTDDIEKRLVSALFCYDYNGWPEL